MSDENAKKAISDVSHALEMWFGSQLAEWPDNPTKYFGTPAREAVMAGRASRDAEVGSLRQRLAEAEQTMVELKPDPVLVEGSWFEVDDLPTILGNFMRSNAEYARVAKVTWIQVDSLQQQLAERDAVIERVRDYWLTGPTGMNYFHVNGFPNRLVQLGDLFSEDAEKFMRDTLAAAPSSTLDALIRQKQAEALEGWADEVQPHFPVYAGKTRERAAEYRNGADHE